MRLDLKNISRKDFRVRERQHPVLGTVMLITPTPSKHRWKLDELHLRSLLVRTDGTIICSGFPKFRNYGEDADEGLMFEEYLESEEVIFPEKMDGSLIIRSVIDGYVNFRTRGSHQLADTFVDPVMSLVREKYPKLLSPTYRQGASMLFEYTAPTNRIVLQYEDARLTTLGIMNLCYDETLPKFFGSRHIVEDIANETGVDSLKFHDFSFDLSKIRSEIAGWIGSEGVVAWCGDGAMLIKIKTDDYIKIHSLKYHLTEDRVRKLAWFGGMSSVNELKDRFFEMGLDWESVDFAREYMESFLRDKELVQTQISKFLASVDEAGIIDLPSKKRQALALKKLTSDKRMLAAGFKHIAGDAVGVENFIAAKLLKIPVNALSKARLDIETYIGE